MEDKQMILDEENAHQFKEFNALTAYRIGSFITEKVMKENLKVCVDIFAYGKQLYHFCNDPCSVDNESWLIRKRNTVLHFGNSTRFMNCKLEGNAELLQSKYGLSASDTTLAPGGFPIRLENCGVIGAICVSGLAPLEDHQLVLDGIESLQTVNK